jgi:hypothetical protein
MVVNAKRTVRSGWIADLRWFVRQRRGCADTGLSIDTRISAARDSPRSLPTAEFRRINAVRTTDVPDSSRSRTRITRNRRGEATCSGDVSLANSAGERRKPVNMPLGKGCCTFSMTSATAPADAEPKQKGRLARTFAPSCSKAGSRHRCFFFRRSAGRERVYFYNTTGGRGFFCSTRD